MFADDAFAYDDPNYRTKDKTSKVVIPPAKSANEPYSPADAAAAKTSAIPSVVFGVINELLAKYVANGRATFKQSDIIEGVRARTEGTFEYAWLNFEDAYKARGWHVSCDAPGFNESYPAMYTFSDASRWAS